MKSRRKNFKLLAVLVPPFFLFKSIHPPDILGLKIDPVHGVRIYNLNRYYEVLFKTKFYSTEILKPKIWKCSRPQINTVLWSTRNDKILLSLVLKIRKLFNELRDLYSFMATVSTVERLKPSSKSGAQDLTMYLIMRFQFFIFVTPCSTLT